MSNIRSSQSHEKFNFRPPPECPVFAPTLEQFKDPMEFFGCVSHIGIKTDLEKFRFTPRIQRLYELEAQSRIKLKFISRLYEFHKLHKGQPLKIPCISGNYLDLYKLHKLVAENGSYQIICENRKWSQITELLGYPGRLAHQIKTYYEKILLAFDMIVEGDNSNHESSQKLIKRKRATVVNDVYDIESSENSELKKLRLEQSIDQNVCKSEEDDTHLLICDNEKCQACYHIQCLTPPLNSVPNFSWKCPDCVREACKKSYGTYGFPQSVKNYSLDEFGNHADNFKASYFNCRPDLVPTEMVEQEFWRILQEYNDDVIVEYGADIHSSHQGSGFPTEVQLKNELDPNYKGKRVFLDRGKEYFDNAMKYAHSPWNLNNLPVLSKSILRFIQGDISGMKVPWCYVGMVFSSFCWHIEDHWSYSINYNHWGEPKTWYGVSSLYADKFEDAMRRQASELFDESPDLLHHITTIMNPNILEDEGVPVYKTNQYPGEFVLTFPRSYHAGFNHGFNFAEAVNFCLPDWLPMGRCCVNDYVTMRRQCVFSHQQLVWVLCQIATNRIAFADVKSTIPPTVACSIDFQAGLDPLAIEIVRQELEALINDEIQGQQYCKQIGNIKSRKIVFEDLSDDERSCLKCQTTLYFSSLSCSCTLKDDQENPQNDEDNKDGTMKNFSNCRKVCLEHVHELCNKCNADQFTLYYSHTIEELQEILDQIKTVLTKQKVNHSRLGAILKRFNECHLIKQNQPLNQDKILALPSNEDIKENFTLADIKECIETYSDHNIGQNNKNDYGCLKKIYSDITMLMDAIVSFLNYMESDEPEKYLDSLEESKRTLRFNIQKAKNCKKEKQLENLKKISLLVPYEFSIKSITVVDIFTMQEQLESKSPPLDLNNDENYIKLQKITNQITDFQRDLKSIIERLPLPKILLNIYEETTNTELISSLSGLITTYANLGRIKMTEFDIVESIIGLSEKLKSKPDDENATTIEELIQETSDLDQYLSATTLDLQLNGVYLHLKYIHQSLRSKLTTKLQEYVNKLDLVSSMVICFIEELESDYHKKQHSEIKLWMETMEKLSLHQIFISPLSLFSWDLLSKVSQKQKKPQETTHHMNAVHLIIERILVNFDKFVNLWTTKSRKLLNIRENYSTFIQARDLKILGNILFKSFKSQIANKETSHALILMAGEYEKLIGNIKQVYENLSKEFSKICTLFDQNIAYNVNQRKIKSLPLISYEQEIISICRPTNGKGIYDDDVYQFLSAVDRSNEATLALFSTWISEFEKYTNDLIDQPKSCQNCQIRDSKFAVVDCEHFSDDCDFCLLLSRKKPCFLSLENLVSEMQSQTYFIPAIKALHDFFNSLVVEMHLVISKNGCYISDSLDQQFESIFSSFNLPKIKLHRHASVSKLAEISVTSFKKRIYNFYIKFSMLPVSSRLQDDIIKFLLTNL